MKTTALHGPAGGIGESPAAGSHRLKEACEQFEAIFTGYMLKSMRETVMKAEEGDSASGLYEGMMDETLAVELSRGSGLGLAQMLYRQLASAQEEAPRDGSAFPQVPEPRDR